MNISLAELRRQYQRTKASGWLAMVQRAARRFGFSTAQLLAHASRETNIKNIRGDYRDGRYNGFGVMQVDIGTDAAYARAWTPQNVEPSIIRGAEILNDKLQQVFQGQGRLLKFKKRQFTGRRVEEDDARRIAAAAYNCGLWAYYHFSKGENVDTTTTGDDYSRDVYDRAIEFAALLDEDGTEPGALRREVALQGKYARASARARIGVHAEGLPERAKMPAGEPEEAQTALARVDARRDDEDGEPVAPGVEEVTGEEAPPEVLEEAPAPPERPSAAAPAPAPAAPPAVVVEATPPAPPAAKEPEESSFEDRAKKVARQVKAWHAAIPAALVAYGSAALAWLRDPANLLLIIALLAVAGVVVVVFVVMNYRHSREKDRLKAAAEAREHELNTLREKHAFELTKLQVETAADPQRATVRVVAPGQAAGD